MIVFLTISYLPRLDYTIILSDSCAELITNGLGTGTVLFKVFEFFTIRVFALISLSDGYEIDCLITK